MYDEFNRGENASGYGEYIQYSFNASREAHKTTGLETLMIK